MKQRPLLPLSPLTFALLLALGLLSACEGNDLHNAEMRNTPEAYEEFLIKYPESDKADELSSRIDELRFLRAKREKTAAAFLDYLDKHPTSANAEEATRAADELGFKEAEETNTNDAYLGYLKGFPGGAFRDKAEQAAAQIRYVVELSVEDIALQEINLARDPEGPLNGWELTARVRNNGEEKLRVVEVAIDLLAANGTTLKTDSYWAVAPDLGGFPTPEWMKPSLAPQSSRDMIWTTGDIPEGWANQVAVRVKRVEFKSR